MKWVYILKCDDFYYVGETSRLYRRFWDQIESLNDISVNIVAIYKVNIISNFIKYNNYVNDFLNKINDHVVYKHSALKLLKYWDTNCCVGDDLRAEQNITKCLMTKDLTKIRGQYTRYDIHDLPLCKCGLPCDVSKHQDMFYFRCVKNNMWDGFKEEFKIYDEPCKFYMKYTKDSAFRLEMTLPLDVS